MKLANHVAGAGLALTFRFWAPLLWAQATQPGIPGSTSVVPAATSPIVPPECFAPGVPGIPANTQNPAGPVAVKSNLDAIAPEYVAQKITDARLRGKNVRKAKAE